MSSKKMYILVIIAGILLVCGSLFMVLASNSLKESNIVKSSALVFMFSGAVCLFAGIAFIIYIAYHILKDKKII